MGGKVNLRENFSRNLKACRLRQGLTQEQLAEKAEVSVRLLQRLENIPFKNVTLLTVEKFAAALKVEPSELIKSNGGQGKLTRKERESLETSVRVINSILVKG